MIGEKERYHGIALARLIQDTEGELAIEAQKDKSRCAYILNGNCTLFLKYSTNLLSPWPFVFSSEQRKEINTLSDRFPEVWIVMVCGREGIAAVNWNNASDRLVRREESDGFSLLVSRKRRHNFRVSGSREKPLLVSDSDFPGRILGN